MESIKTFLCDEKSTEVAEWAIIIGVIAVGAIAALVAIGTWVNNTFTALETGITATP